MENSPTRIFNVTGYNWLMEVRRLEDFLIILNLDGSASVFLTGFTTMLRFTAQKNTNLASTLCHSWRTNEESRLYFYIPLYCGFYKDLILLLQRR